MTKPDFHGTADFGFRVNKRDSGVVVFWVRLPEGVRIELDLDLPHAMRTLGGLVQAIEVAGGEDYVAQLKGGADDGPHQH